MKAFCHPYVAEAIRWIELDMYQWQDSLVTAPVELRYRVILDELEDSGEIVKKMVDNQWSWVPCEQRLERIAGPFSLPFSGLKISSVAKDNPEVVAYRDALRVRWQAIVMSVLDKSIPAFACFAQGLIKPDGECDGLTRWRLSKMGRAIAEAF